MGTTRVCAYGALMLLSCAVNPLAAQPKEPTVYTYIAEFRVSRAKAAAFNSFFEQTDQAVLDRLVADGTIREWGRTSTLVHSEDGMTDGIWWSSTTFSGIDKVLEELGKANSSSLADLVDKHADHYMESIVFRTGSSKATSGFLQESTYVVKPGKGEEWFGLWKKWMQPVYEKALADGTIVGYGIDRESLHTMAAGYRSVWVIVDSASAADKLDEAFDAAMGKLSPEERKTMSLQNQELLEPGTHRDNLYKVIHYTHR
jgi:hypothetical protein